MLPFCNEGVIVEQYVTLQCAWVQYETSVNYFSMHLQQLTDTM